MSPSSGHQMSDRSPELWHPRSEDVFYINEGGGESPETFTSPIRKQVPGIGEVTRLDGYEALPGRDDNWFSVEVDGFKIGVRVTEPVPEEDLGVNLVHLPGFTMLIESGPGKWTHDGFAKQNPGLRVVSIGSDGVGDTAEKLTRENMWEHGIDGMAEERLKLVQALCSDDPTILNGLSMGSIINFRMLDIDIHSGRNLNARPVNIASAIVTPENVGTYIVGMFMPSMLIDAPRELKDMYHRYGLLGTIERVKSPRRHLKGNLLPWVVEMTDIRKGTPFERIRRVTKAISTITISGNLDPLNQFPMWQQLKRDREVQDLTIKAVYWRGHGMATDGEKTASQTLHTIETTHLLDRLAA